MKVNSSIHESKSVVKSVKLSNGGFVEIKLSDANSGYLKVQVSLCNSIYKNYNGSWRWMQHETDRKNIKILTEIRNACDALLDSLDG